LVELVGCVVPVRPSLTVAVAVLPVGGVLLDVEAPGAGWTVVASPAAAVSALAAVAVRVMT
jgi:hypothetical protein